MSIISRRLRGVHGLERVIAALTAAGSIVLGAFWIAKSNLTAWAVYWLLVFFLFFLVPELYWVKVDPRNTVSDNTWRFESLDLKHPFEFSEWTSVHWIFAVVFTLFAMWLWIHLIFGLLRG